MNCCIGVIVRLYEQNGAWIADLPFCAENLTLSSFKEAIDFSLREYGLLESGNNDGKVEAAKQGPPKINLECGPTEDIQGGWVYYFNH